MTLPRQLVDDLLSVAVLNTHPSNPDYTDREYSAYGKAKVEMAARFRLLLGMELPSPARTTDEGDEG